MVLNENQVKSVLMAAAGARRGGRVPSGPGTGDVCVGIIGDIIWCGTRGARNRKCLLIKLIQSMNPYVFGLFFPALLERPNE